MQQGSGRWEEEATCHLRHAVGVHVVQVQLALCLRHRNTPQLGVVIKKMTLSCTVHAKPP